MVELDFEKMWAVNSHKNFIFEEYYNEDELIARVPDGRNLSDSQAIVEYGKIKRYISDVFGTLPDEEYKSIMGKIQDRLKI